MPFFPAEDSKLRARSLSIRRGGNCPNSLEVLQQLLQPRDDLKPYLVTSLPEKASPATKRIIDSFGQESPVDFGYCQFRENHTEPACSWIIRSEETGSRTLVNYNELPEITTQEFEAVVNSFDGDQETWWHFEVNQHL